MKTKRIEVEVRGLPGAPKEEAELIVCECGAEVFVIYFPASSPEHRHLQCAECGISYCDGLCSGAPTPSPAQAQLEAAAQALYNQRDATPAERTDVWEALDDAAMMLTKLGAGMLPGMRP